MQDRTQNLQFTSIENKPQLLTSRIHKVISTEIVHFMVIPGKLGPQSVHKKDYSGSNAFFRGSGQLLVNKVVVTRSW